MFKSTFPLVFLIAISVPCFCFGQELREWKSKSGKFSVQAEFVAYESGKVELKRENGKTIQVELTKLSKDDQAFVRKMIRKMKANAKAKAKDSTTSDTQPEIADTSINRNWFQWRGPNRDGIAVEKGLLSRWPSGGPPLQWTADGIGRGMSSVVVAGEDIFTMGDEGGEKLFSINASDGSIKWSTPVGNGGESNSTPLYFDGKVYTLGRGGDLACVNAKDGKKLWQISLTRDLGGKMMSQWGYSESLLIDPKYPKRLICTPGGERAMVAAIDIESAKVIWSTPMRRGGDRGQDGAGYASVVISEAGGVRQYITLVGRGLISVSANDGTALWQYEKVANGTANCPTPIVFDDYVFCSSGYDDGGSALLQISRRGNGVGFKEIYYKRSNDLQNHHGGMIKIGDHLYLGHGHNNGFPMCIDLRSGRKLWPRQRGAGTGSAAVAAADGHLYFRYQDGTMALIEANPKEYKLKGSFRIKTVHKESWPAPVIANGKLYLRDAHNLHCYNIKAD